MNINADDDGDLVFNCIDEAKAIINDVKSHVDEILISNLPCDATHIYLNIRTIEGTTCCVQVSSRGFKIVSSLYDTVNKQKENANPDEDEIFETPYALLDKISPQYVESFGNKLCQQLRQLQQMRTEFNEADEDDEE
ncbi:GSK3-beta interaction protein [Scaptodrosophila lebanonensis]|uniref:GSK3-beta interaction protein n=1 Tax=Drosophila lebanonensis TaxID=7225 RepID=A0A6J2TJ48_DROLE|nr:GSK3-beta interaction protein [Scaptodrosophila lebanonensis]